MGSRADANGTGDLYASERKRPAELVAHPTHDTVGRAERRERKPTTPPKITWEGAANGISKCGNVHDFRRR